jgi:hypothetical protein
MATRAQASRRVRGRWQSTRSLSLSNSLLGGLHVRAAAVPCRLQHGALPIVVLRRRLVDHRRRRHEGLRGGTRRRAGGSHRRQERRACGGHHRRLRLLLRTPPLAATRGRTLGRIAHRRRGPRRAVQLVLARRLTDGLKELSKVDAARACQREDDRGRGLVSECGQGWVRFDQRLVSEEVGPGVGEVRSASGERGGGARGG